MLWTSSPKRTCDDMRFNNDIEPERLSELRIMQIRAKAMGSSVHMVYNLIGAYQMATMLMDQHPKERQWREMAQRNAEKLQVFFKTGQVELCADGLDDARQYTA
jgi:hypothetical protein